MEFKVRSVSQIFWGENIKEYNEILSKYGEYVEEDTGDKYYKIQLSSLYELADMGKKLYKTEKHPTIDINFEDKSIEIVDDYRD